ncbi:MAG: hypothetical protein CMO78_05365 [Verrucomicrobiales bacterium]|nr:hypothetical protein [Verrucomicrobiales bacterium]
MKPTLVFSCAALALASALAAAPGVKVTPLTVPTNGKAGFERLKPEETGLMPKGAFKKVPGEGIRDTGNSGLAAGDINGDGLPDLYVCGMEQPNALYLNKGNWKFENITEAAGVACKGWRLSGALMVDLEGDGDLDLVLTSLRDSRNFVFLNDGAGKFTESLDKFAWVSNPRGGNVGATASDVDGDGDLDLYFTAFLKRFHTEELGREGVARIEALGEAARAAGKPMPAEWRKYYSYRPVPVAPGRVRYQMDAHHVADQLYLNHGKDGFRAVRDTDGRFRNMNGEPMPMPKDPSHEAAFRDVDGDGDPDLYVCSDFDWADRFWKNDGAGNFTLVHPLTLRRTSQFSMGLDFADINRDEHLDFLTVDMLSRSHMRRKTQMGFMQPTDVAIGLVENRPQIMQNTLHLARGDGRYTEIAQYAGVRASEWSWGVAFSDVDLDGYEDLIVATGMIRDFMDADATQKANQANSGGIKSIIETHELFPELRTQNVIYRNKGDLTFEFKSDDWGFTGEEAVSGGLVQADFDGDGDLDLIFNNIGPLEIYRNESAAPRVAVRLKGSGKNTQAIGAKVRLLGGPGGPAPIEQEIHAGGGYASGSDPLAVFGTGTQTKGLQLEIIWRRRSQLERRVIENVKPNHLYEITQGNDTPHVPPVHEARELWFADDFEKLSVETPQGMASVVHRETAFDDFAYQSLLPNRLSQLGPGVAWTDLNGDGRDDLVVGSGRGGPVVVYHVQADGKFKFSNGANSPLDQTGLLGWTPKAGAGPILLTGFSNYEAPDREFIRPAIAQGLDPAKKFGIAFSLPGQTATAGPMALADVDGDGDLDLFIGGRTVPARYPEPGDSFLYINDNGTLKLDTANEKVLKKLGLVSGAVFGDLDNDGDADLVLAVEWGPIKVLRNDGGKFADATAAYGLDKYHGWWNSVTLGDFDGDGRLDIVAGNWGRNSKYEGSYSEKEPLRISYSDFDDNGVLDIVEYHRDKITGQLVPERGRSCTMNAMPFIGKQNETFEVFGKRSLEEVYGACLKEGTVLTANVLDSVALLNRGDKFERVNLPAEAQFAPVFGVNVADFDGDGHEDIFLAQNFFASQRETPRSDGGRSVLLRGDGKGGFKYVPGQQTGLRIYGEQRGSAVADYDEDGRPDLVVTQNGSFNRLFRNTHAQPGLRVKLNAGPANPTGVGARLRLVFEENKTGPARLITAGSGYWSQDSATQILATASAPTHLEVTWPGGNTTRTPVPEGAKAMSVDHEGKIVP